MESLAEIVREQPAMPRFEDGSVNLRELMRRIAEDVVNAIMNAEADQLCAGGANSRNGYRERNPVTCVGDITMRIPKLRSGSFFPEDVVERYQRVDRAVVSAIGCDEGGWRRVLGLLVVDTESYDSWLGFLRRIRGRGVHGVQLVTFNAHTIGSTVTNFRCFLSRENNSRSVIIQPFLLWCLLLNNLQLYQWC